MDRQGSRAPTLEATPPVLAGSRRPVVLRASTESVGDEALARVVALLARGLERLVTGKDAEQDGREVEAGLDFLPHQSVTTPQAIGCSEECR